MFGNVLILVLREFAGPIRLLIQGAKEANEEKMKHAIIELESAAKGVAIKKLRGG